MSSNLHELWLLNVHEMPETFSSAFAEQASRRPASLAWSELQEDELFVQVMLTLAIRRVMTKPILKITPPLEPYGDCIADAVLAAAVHLGSDGRGRGGLRGYMISLGREHPEALLKLLNKVLKAELLSFRRTVSSSMTRHRQASRIGLR